MRSLLIIYFVLNCHLLLPQEIKTLDTLELWIPRSPTYEEKSAFQSTCNSWHLKYKFVPDTLEDDKYSYILEEHNRKIWWEFLKLGITESEQKFWNELSKELDKTKKATGILLVDSSYRKVYQQITENKNHIYFKILKNNDSIYSIEIYYYKINHIEKLFYVRKYTLNIFTKHISM